ncbi:hypothetical protein EW146_g5857 [Bondarzewia mesenterica]|uniref:Uncharacterized protein n=1 Tax=Bondarzewia mesenterica TaxID=1095465 RepID=A0A4S4LSB0_9AGAM|nr:hypothetical protein EW146_g5857 [Bondarzewia mesenterica]
MLAPKPTREQVRRAPKALSHIALGIDDGTPPRARVGPRPQRQGQGRHRLGVADRRGPSAGVRAARRGGSRESLLFSPPRFRGTWTLMQWVVFSSVLSPHRARPESTTRSQHPRASNEDVSRPVSISCLLDASDCIILVMPLSVVMNPFMLTDLFIPVYI